MDAETAARFEELLLLTEGALVLARRGTRKSPSDDDADVKRLIALGGVAVAALAAKLDAGSLTQEQFITQALAAIRGHAQTAAGIGAAQFAGEPDRGAVDDLVDTQSDFLSGFADDITGGDLSADAIAARAALYGGAIWTALQLGKGQGATDAGLTQCWWDLDPGAQHCDDCPEYAAGSPYAYPDELPTYPGQDVACQSNCRCALRFEGEAGADDEEEKAAPVVLVAEARCPICNRWVGRNVNVGAEVYCPVHKGVVITAAAP